MPRRYREDWDELARREPYFAVLTDPGFLRENLDDARRKAFFASGEADVERLFAAIEQGLSGPFSPETALDFGSGVGRLTVPLARRVPAVTGCDISPRMVEEARKNASELNAPNATFVTSLDELSGARFDLVCSLIVFQHIPVREGMATLRQLLRLLAPGGVAAIHLPLHRGGGRARRIARRIRGAVPFIHRAALRLRGDALDLPYMQMNAYDRGAVEQLFREGTGAAPRMIHRTDGDTEGAVFVAQRPRG